MHRSNRLLLVLGLSVALTVVAVGPIAAHETQSVEGYDLTFGGTDEPLITGERMWLELEIVNNSTGEPVANQSETLNISVQKKGHEKMSLDVSERFGEPGVYEAPVIFTEPGNYIVHVRGSVEGNRIHTHFEITVHDRTDLRYPSTESQSNTTQSNQSD